MATIGDFKAEVERYGKDLYIQELEQRVEELKALVCIMDREYVGSVDPDDPSAPQCDEHVIERHLNDWRDELPQTPGGPWETRQDHRGAFAKAGARLHNPPSSASRRV